MPEGDTVYQAAGRLDRALAGRVLDRVDLRVPRYATVDLDGARYAGTVPRGKHLLTRLEHDSGAWTLHTHLKMEGIWQTTTADGGKWRRPAHQARVVLTAGPVQAIGFALGTVDLLATEDEDDAVGHLGPDLLGPDWDPAEAERRLRERPERPLVEALLDQRNLAGIGNVYVNEICFVMGIHPTRSVEAVPDLPRLLRRSQAMLDANRDRSSRCTTGVLRRGQQLWVYGRGGDPCRRCRARVRVAMRGDTDAPERGERSTYWCPHCQPEG
ncbi:MAG TPA: DNA-formamidopyrimidine glycosylase family protein [Nocardioides sp.]